MVRFFFFLQFAVNSPGVRLSVVGFCSSLLAFLCSILVLFAASYFISC